jgi:RNA polymerase sigma factor (sigma-70 family)
MDNCRLELVLRHLHARVDPQLASAPSDGQLLERFAIYRDEAAFELLVRRHGPLVWSVCRRILGNAPDADDAFQATFLVFVRKAESLDRLGSVAGWLHGVAYRVAVRARANIWRRRCLETKVGALAAACSDAAAAGELRQVLDEELGRLPEKYRVALVLCCLQGKTYKEAAAELHWPLGTLNCRLVRGREQLRWRLARRGIVLPTGLLAAALADEAARAAVPVPLVNATLRFSLSFAAGNAAAGQVPVAVAALAEGVLQAMCKTKLKIAVGLMLVLCTIGSSAGVAAYHGGFAGTTTGAAVSEPVSHPDLVAAAGGDAIRPAAPAVLETAWNELAGADETKAMRAILTLAAAPKESVPFLKENLRPVTVDARRIARLIADLDSDTFAVRQRAAEELESIGEYAVQYLRGAADGNPPLDVKKRIEAVLEKIKSGTRPASWVRAVRAIAVLEFVGTADARQILEGLARGRTKAWPTQEAEAALDRLIERPLATLQSRYADLRSRDEGKVARALLALTTTPKETVQLIGEEVKKALKAPPPAPAAPKDPTRATILALVQAEMLAGDGKVHTRLPLAPAVATGQTITQRVTVLLEQIDTPEARKLLETIGDKKLVLAAPDVGSTSTLSPDGKVSATVADGGTIHLHDVATGKIIWAVQGPVKAVSLAFSADGTTLISKSSDGTVSGWEVATGKQLWKQALP